MTTLADQSDMGAWPTWVLLLRAIPLAITVITIISVTFNPHRVKVMGAELSNLDRADGLR